MNDVEFHVDRPYRTGVLPSGAFVYEPAAFDQPRIVFTFATLEEARDWAQTAIDCLTTLADQQLARHQEANSQ